ncbi:hypothetical protein HGRIS_014859 [Hohenbuehelia grisea]|uniref:Vacuolar protein sorting-associated protein 27 n=1 Tax=Hohenbuehelia grisea TaxID=104357 RepID=A0ABR3IQY3_9AGAR
MSLSSWLWGTSQLDDAVDKATSELLPAGQEDIALNLEICDQIRSKAVPAKDAMRALKRRLNHKNPNVQLLALGLTDICIKNGGDLFLSEVASREFMDNLVSILKIPALNHDVKNTILRLVQTWSISFEGKPNLNYVGQVYKTLNNEGYKFPPKDLVATSSAMVDTQTAPEWIDSDVCLRCRTAFTFTNRKHHCRNCGQVFDQQCSSKMMPLPHFGIAQEVRVCDGCHSKLTKKAEQKADKIHRHSSSRHASRQAPPRDFSDAELQRAIELSLQEVGGSSGHARPGYVPAQPEPAKYQYSEPPLVDRYSRPTASDDEDPDLKAAIEASLREASAPKPSAPVALEEPSNGEARVYNAAATPPSVPQSALPHIPNYDLAPLEEDAILTFSQTIEQVQAQGGRDMSRYPAVNELYDKATSLRPKLALSLDDADRKEQMLSEMHDKLSQAVKLYDQLLTQQISHPRWRSPQPAVVPQHAYQPSMNTDNPTYAPTVSGYAQWPAQAQGVAVATLPGTYQASPAPDPSHQQSQWVAQSASAYQAQPSIHQHPPGPQFAQSPPPAPPASYQPMSPPPAPAPVPPASLPTAPPFMPPQSGQTQQYASSIHSVSSPPPVTANSQLPPMPPSPAVARHQSMSYSRTPQPHVGLGLSRSNTMASGMYTAGPPQGQQQHPPTVYQPGVPVNGYQQSAAQQQQQQYATAPAQVPALPDFPAVPTAPLQGYQAYSSPMPERKEALLIDL